MRKISVGLCILILALSLSACSDNGEVSNTEISSQTRDSGKVTAQPQENVAESHSFDSQPDIQEEEDTISIDIAVGDEVFPATLYKNEATQELVSMLPMTVDMRDMNSNEKYYYLDRSLPTNASVPSEIRTGDLMLYGSDCLVLFYETFTTGYSYTPLGTVDNPQSLKSALGSGDAQVTFTAK